MTADGHDPLSHRHTHKHSLAPAWHTLISIPSQLNHITVRVQSNTLHSSPCNAAPGAQICPKFPIAHPINLPAIVQRRCFSPAFFLPLQNVYDLFPWEEMGRSDGGGWAHVKTKNGLGPVLGRGVWLGINWGTGVFLLFSCRLLPWHPAPLHSLHLSLSSFLFLPLPSRHPPELGLFLSRFLSGLRHRSFRSSWRSQKPCWLFWRWPLLSYWE